MRRILWSTVALAALLSGCEEEPGAGLEPVDTGPPVLASEAQLLELHELASDPYLVELMGTLEARERDRMEGALTTFGAGVPIAPHRSYLKFEAALHPFESVTPELSDESDAPVALEVLDLYRTWSEATLYGTEH